MCRNLLTFSDEVANQNHLYNPCPSFPSGVGKKEQFFAAMWSFSHTKIHILIHILQHLRNRRCLSLMKWHFIHAAENRKASLCWTGEVCERHSGFWLLLDLSPAVRVTYKHYIDILFREDFFVSVQHSFCVLKASKVHYSWYNWNLSKA